MPDQCAKSSVFSCSVHVQYKQIQAVTKAYLSRAQSRMPVFAENRPEFVRCVALPPAVP